MFSQRTDTVPELWEDAEVRFDSPAKALRPRRGEVVLHTLEGVEDAKGGAGERGTLTLSNLRFTWHRTGKPRTNISASGCREGHGRRRGAR